MQEPSPISRPPRLQCEQRKNRRGVSYESGSVGVSEHAGRKRYAVGGFVLVHSEDGNPGKLDADLQAESLVWTHVGTGSPPLEKEPTNYDKDLGRLNDFFQKRGIGVSAFGLRRPLQSSVEKPRSLLLRDGSLDLQNWDMVTDAIEAALFDIVDHVAPEPSSVCVHLATRTPPVDPGLDIDRAIQDWGFSIRPDQPPDRSKGQLSFPRKKALSITPSAFRMVDKSRGRSCAGVTRRRWSYLLIGPAQ